MTYQIKTYDFRILNRMLIKMQNEPLKIFMRVDLFNSTYKYVPNIANRDKHLSFLVKHKIIEPVRIIFRNRGNNRHNPNKTFDVKSIGYKLINPNIRFILVPVSKELKGGKRIKK